MGSGMVEIADCGRGERATELGHPFLPFSLTNDCETVNVGKVLEIKLDVRPQRTRLPAMKSRRARRRKRILRLRVFLFGSPPLTGWFCRRLLLTLAPGGKNHGRLLSNRLRDHPTSAQTGKRCSDGE